MKAVVLSGGGSKGSYQIGVWKALRKLHIKYDIVTGTSVGALNGALMVQNSYHKAIKLWKKINMQLLFGDEATTSKNKKDVLNMYRDNFIKHGGMNVNNLENIITKYLDEKNFYKSKIDFGLVTVNLSGRKAIQLKKEKIPRNYLCDYLIASAACYPAFQTKDIKGNKYIDGGFFDNLPINLALDLGADSIIAVDLKAPGFKIKPQKKVDTIVIKPNNKLTNFLMFDEIGSRKNIKFGYNDTMKAFGKYIGTKYTFKKYNTNKILDEYQEVFLYNFTSIINTNKLNKVFDLDFFDPNNLILKIAEDIGLFLNLDETKIYSFKGFNKRLLKKFKNQTKRNNSIEIITNLYHKMLNKDYKYLRIKGILNPKEFIYALYLYTISEV